MDQTYRIVRHFKDTYERETIAEGLTRAEAQEHCSDPDSSSRHCTTQEGLLLTAQKGDWFDGFEEE